MSITGTPSVMATITVMPASTASRIASAVNAGGTKIIVALAPVCSTASTHGVEDRHALTFSPALPGVTPPTIFVPYSRHPLVWNWPTLPVIPWQMTRVFLLIEDAHGRVAKCGMAAGANR